MLGLAALISVLVLLRGLRSNSEETYDAVETRGIEFKDTRSAREQLAVDAQDQVSSIDLLPKVSLREADPLEPEPPVPAPAPPPAAPVDEPPLQAAPVQVKKREKKPFYRPELQRKSLPKSRSSNASTKAFLNTAPEVKSAGPSSGATSIGSGPSPNRPRTYRDQTGKATIRN
ncbi:MAG: hypothetical protein COB53_03865 [Elusimicrobia bacterium]|nr:MAG: hypothetical protein COB53_03865 [Elusimicrobiota bacterium]